MIRLSTISAPEKSTRTSCGAPAYGAASDTSALMREVVSTPKTRCAAAMHTSERGQASEETRDHAPLRPTAAARLQACTRLLSHSTPVPLSARRNAPGGNRGSGCCPASERRRTTCATASSCSRGAVCARGRRTNGSASAEGASRRVHLSRAERALNRQEPSDKRRGRFAKTRASKRADIIGREGWCSIEAAGVCSHLSR